jgi:hypothetical protein
MEQLSLCLRTKPCGPICVAFETDKCSGCPDTTCIYCQNICNCSKCHVICGYSLRKDSFLKDIASFSFDSIPKQRPLKFPRFIPIISRENINLSSLQKDIDMVAITPKDLINSGKLSPKAKDGLHDFYRLPVETKIILVLTAREMQLEKLWKYHFENNLLGELKELGLYAITSTNLTVGECHPRLLHLINMRRNNIIFTSLLKAGMSAIPDISWYNKEDLERWIDWLKNNDIHTLSITTQCMKLENRHLFEPLIKDLLILIRSVRKNFHLLFVGPSKIKPISTIISNFSDVSIITSLPFRKAMSGRKAYLFNNEIDYKKEIQKSKENLIIENFTFYKAIIDKKSANFCRYRSDFKYLESGCIDNNSHEESISIIF